MKIVVVGDVHAVPEELDDCRDLIGLVCEVAKVEQVQKVLFMGDQYNTHDAVSTKVIAFWKDTIDQLKAMGVQPVFLVGNHDQVSPTEQYPHAMLAHSTVDVVDLPKKVASGLVGMPYFYNPASFVKHAKELKQEFPEERVLFCHQTFQGARYENGFYAKDAIEPDDVPFDTIISGHIHLPSQFGKVTYVGSPRWRTLSDAGTDRYIYTVEDGKVISKYRTDTVCRRIWAFDDYPTKPADLNQIPEDRRGKDLIRIDVYGPDPDSVRKREAELKSMGARTRGFPDRQKRNKVTEAQGMEVAFRTYMKGYLPPNKTPVETLLKVAEERLAG